MGSESGSRTTTQSQDPYKPAQPAINAGIARLDPTYRQALGLQSPIPGVASKPTQEQFMVTRYQDVPERVYQPGQVGYGLGVGWNPTGAGSYVTRTRKQQVSELDKTAYDLAMRQWEAAQAARQPSVYEQLPEAGANQLLSTIQGDYLNGNPYIDEVIRRSMADVNSQFQGSGRYGSGAWQDALMRGAGGIRYANYAGERQNQLGAVQQAPAYSLYPYQLYKQQLESVYDPLAIYTDLATRYGNVGVQGQSTEPLYRNTGAGIIGGAAAGAGLASAIPAVAATGWGLPVAAVLGGILGGLG